MERDVVYVGLEGVKRLRLPLRTILQLIPGKDGIIRVVRIKLQDGEVLRLIQKLYPLEIPARDEFRERFSKNKTSQIIEQKKCTNQDTEPEKAPIKETRKVVMTRKRRIVKEPQRFKSS